MKNKKIVSIFIALCIMFSFALPVYATPDAYEPNENLADASEVGIMWYTAFNATIDVSSDVDYYKFTALDNGYFTLRLTPPTDKNYGMTVLDKNYNQIANVDNGGAGQAESTTFPVTKGYTYYVIVGSDVGDYSDTSYSLGRYSFSSSYNAAYEVNDTPEQAAEVNMYSGSPITAAINANTDVDYYVFTADSTGTLDLALTGPYTKNYDIFVTDKLNGNVVGESHLGAGQTDHAICSVVSGRQYYIIIHGVTSNDYYSGIPYQIYKAN